MFFNDDQALPMMFNSAVHLHAKKLINILLHLNEKKICHIQPRAVTSTATFVIDVDDIDFMDLCADDLGTWKTNGTKMTFFKILSNSSVNIVSLKQGYRMIRHYYSHGTYSLFHRLIADIQGMLHLLL